MVETVLSCAEVCTAVLFGLICLRLQVLSSSFIDFRRISKKCIIWRMLTKFQQGRQSRVGQSFAIELQDFAKVNAWKAGAVIRSKDW